MDGRKAIEIGKNKGGGRDRCASVGNLEDLVKRKRDGGMSREREEEDIFRKCRKTAITGDGKKKGKRGKVKKEGDISPGWMR